MRIPMYKRVHALYKGDQFIKEQTKFLSGQIEV